MLLTLIGLKYMKLAALVEGELLGEQCQFTYIMFVDPYTIMLCV